MPKTVSLRTMIEQLSGLRDTKDLTAWENGFVTDILETLLLADRDTLGFTERQCQVIESIWGKHFAGALFPSTRVAPLPVLRRDSNDRAVAWRRANETLGVLWK